jgi:heat-inducible transcriptional repressor
MRNERECGLTLSEIRRSYLERTQLPPSTDRQKKQAIIDSMRSVFDEEPEEVHLGGTSNILSQPEFNSSERLQGIFQLIERRKPLVDLLKDLCARGGVNVVVGAENPYHEMKDCAVVAFSYSFGGSSGSVGILGPTRMPYWKVVSLVEYVGNKLSSF